MNEIICECLNITKEDIISAIKKGCTTEDQIIEQTNIGSICGECLDKVREILKEELKNKDKIDIPYLGKLPKNIL